MAGRIVAGLGILLASTAMAVVAAAQDAVPALVQISGDLVDQRGRPLTGVQGVTFALYKEQSDAAPLWVETQTVTADARGHFVALLGATSPNGLPLDLFSTNQARWLGMQAVGQPEHPRTFLASVPYALAQLSVPSTATQAIESPASITQSSEIQKNASTTTTATAALSSGPPTVPIFSIVTDAGGLQSANDGAGTVTLSLVKSCAIGQLLKWNGKVWGCTNDSDVKIGVTGGGLNVLANATSPNIVGGFSGNAVANGAAGATIGGGGENILNGVLCLPGVNCQANNRVTQSFGTVAGGENNQAGDTVGAPGIRSFASVGGGLSNSASGQYSTIPGGFQNAAAGSFSFAAGRSAKANHDGSFVWADNSSTSATASTGPNQFLIRAAGGVRVRGPFNLDDSTSNGVGVLQFPTGAGLFFRSGADNTSYLDRMFISGSNGQVGIGTTTPTTMLDVRGHVNLQDVNNNGVIAFPSNGGGLFLRSGVDNVSYADRMFISGFTGRVGIGTTSPTQALDVVGNVRASGDLISVGSVKATGEVVANGNVRAMGDLVGGGRLCIGTDCRSAWPNGVNGGAVNFLPKFAAPDSVGTSLLFDNGSAVGLGTSTPVGKLHVKGSDLYGGFFETSAPYGIALFGEATHTGEGNPTTGVMGVSDGPDGTGVDGFGSIGVRGRGTWGVVGISSADGAGVTGSGSGSAPGGYFFNLDANGKALVVGATNKIEVLTVRSNGKVGIQNPDPGEALDVNGNVKANGLCLGPDCRVAWPSGGGTITGVTPGFGLSGGGTTGNISLGVDFAATQKRITASCGSGSAVRAVDEQGLVACEPVVSTGLTGTGGVNFLTKFTGPNMLGGSQIFDNGATVGIGTNDPDRETKLEVDATGNITTTFAGLFQNSTPGGAALGAYYRNTDSGGQGIVAATWGVRSFAILGTSYSEVDGGGIAGDSYNAIGVFGNSHSPSGVGGYFRNADFRGKALVAATPDRDEVLTVTANGNIGVRNPSPAEVLDVNGSVKALKFIGDGSMLTNLPSGGGGTITGVTPLQGLSGGGTSGNVSLGIAAGGVTNAMLQNSSVTLNAGAGLSGSGAVSLGGSGAPLSVDFATTQQRVAGVCASGQAIRVVNQNGTVNCESVVSAGLTGTGNVNSLSKFIGPGTLGSTAISDDGTNIVVGLNGGGLRLLGTNGAPPNIVGGFGDNSISSGVIGGTISGGGFYGFPNTVTGGLGSIGGGYGNSADIAGTVAGGTLNSAFQDAAVGGGLRNIASGNVATVPGGFGNVAAGAYSFAAGVYANAKDEGAFVWANPMVDPVSLQMIPFSSTGPNQFLIRASGGVGIGTNIVDPAVAALIVAGRVKSDGLCLGSDCRSAWPSGGGGITAVTAGLGLFGGGTIGDVSLGVDFAAAQKRITGSCGSGFAVRAVDQQGLVDCAAVVSTGLAGTGTPGKLSKFITPTTLGDSQIIENPINGTVTVGVLNEPNDATVSVGGIMVQASAGATPNIVAGFTANLGGSAAAFSGVTISGGGDSGSPNRATGSFASIGGGVGNTAGSGGTIGGGWTNTASTNSVVGGGQNNSASGGNAAIGGGFENTASNSYATVPGGSDNVAAGLYSFAAGRQAKANHQGSLVWADSLFFDVTSTAANEFTARSTGGVRFISAVSGSGAPTAGVRLAPGAGAWSSLSDRNFKENFSAVDGTTLLDKLKAIRVESWNYKSQDTSIRHIGPMAQDFYAAFGLGEDNTHISTIDADGVALAGVQALYRLLLQKDEEIVRQQRELQKLRNDLDTIQNLVKQLSAGSAGGLNRAGGSDK